ncbi:MAG: hypothetical protein LC737_05015, partial [Chloroflexi bacterium]|nr:hypothetical protein [Chloroflexota bacterium]
RLYDIATKNLETSQKVDGVAPPLGLENLYFYRASALDQLNGNEACAIMTATFSDEVGDAATRDTLSPL